MSALVLGIDSSTQSCKAELRSAPDGDLVASGSAPHPRTRPPTSEQPASSWWDALVPAVRKAIGGLPQPWRPADVVAVSVAAQCHGLVLLDHRDEVIRPVKLWNDITSAPQIERLRGMIGPEAWIETVGSLPTAAFTIGKVAWVAEHEPHQLARASTIVLPHDWLTYQLTGQLVTDRSDASGTGYFDSAADMYRRDLLELAIGRPSTVTLPTVLGPDDQAGMLLSGPAEQLGLRTGIPVGPGGGDQHLSALGLGVRPGEIVYSIGTSGVVFTSADHPVRDGSGMVDGVADATGRWLPLCSTLNAAKVADTVAGWLGVDHDGLGDLAAAADADPDRPVLAAFFDGERKPDLPHATGVLAGLTSATRREAFALGHRGISSRSDQRPGRIVGSRRRSA